MVQSRDSRRWKLLGKQSDSDINTTAAAFWHHGLGGWSAAGKMKAKTNELVASDALISSFDGSI